MKYSKNKFPVYYLGDMNKKNSIVSKYSNMN